MSAAGVLVFVDFALCMALFFVTAKGADRAERRAYWRRHPSTRGRFTVELR